MGTFPLRPRKLFRFFAQKPVRLYACRVCGVGSGVTVWLTCFHIFQFTHNHLFLYILHLSYLLSIPMTRPRRKHPSSPELPSVATIGACSQGPMNGLPSSQREKKAKARSGWYCGTMWPLSLTVRKVRVRRRRVYGHVACGHGAQPPRPPRLQLRVPLLLGKGAYPVSVRAVGHACVHLRSYACGRGERRRGQATHRAAGFGAAQRASPL